MDLSAFMQDRVLRKEKIETGEVQMANKFSKRMVLAIDVLIIIGFEEIAQIGVEGC